MARPPALDKVRLPLHGDAAYFRFLGKQFWVHVGAKFVSVALTSLNLWDRPLGDPLSFTRFRR